MFTQKDLKLFEYIIKKYSLHFIDNLICYLTFWDKKNSPLKQRLSLRKVLIHKIETLLCYKLCAKQKAILCTLDKPPALLFTSISISHTQKIGGFIVSSAKYSIGFDLELFNRVTNKTMLYISNPTELNLAPSPSALWSAKEASYKSIKLSVTSIKQICIFDWKPIVLDHSNDDILKNISLQIYHYKFKTKNTCGVGFVCIVNTLVIGFAKSLILR